MSRSAKESKYHSDFPDSLRCPNCLNQLTAIPCERCGEVFNTILGIIDLRWPKSTENNAKYNESIRHLLADYNKLTYVELVDSQYKGSQIPERFQVIYRDYQSNLIKRGAEMLEMFQTKLNFYYKLPGHDIALDIGCGVGAGTVFLASQFNHVIGIDPSMPSLILARKFCDEHEIKNITFVQAYAQNLPIQNQKIDYAVAQNVIEHLFYIKPAFDEIYRVLCNRGCFCGDSRNRFDLFLPEPHAQLRWVGFWPRKLQPWYVKLFRNTSYESAHLLSLCELQRNAKKVFGKACLIAYPLSTAYGRSAKWDKYLSIIERIPLINKLLLSVFPSHLLIAQAQKQ